MLRPAFLAFALLHPVAAIAQQPTASQALAALFRESDEGELRRNPLTGIFRGDLRYADRFGDGITDAYFAAEHTAARDELARLARIDRAGLTEDERVSADAFRWQRTIDLTDASPEIVRLTATRPLTQNDGLHVRFVDFSSGEGAAPFRTLADYENNLKRLAGFATWLDRAIVRMRAGAAAGVVQPRAVMERVAGQLDAIVAQGVEGSAYYRPVATFPAAIAPADQARLKTAYTATIRDTLLPAYARLRDYVRADYLPRTRAGVGLSHMPGGPDLYRHLVARATTTELTPDAIHATGLAEVARIQRDIATIQREVGFEGTLAQLFEHVRTDPRFKHASRDAMRASFEAIGRRVEPRLAELFSTIPKGRLEIRPVPALREASAAGGSYQSGTLDGARPGVFYFNAYDLPSRATPGDEALYLHEGAPGHHFQIALAQENTALPAFQRFGGNTAFVEGWALYAETLGPRLGVYTDPYQRFGALDSELFRAVRLVVDTGLHTRGWSREQAIDYMLANTSESRTAATSEIERYIARPAQALSYKIGALKIAELRARAERALGPRFDIREFHAQVLGSGALPLAVLEAKIDRWIASRRAA